MSFTQISLESWVVAVSVIAGSVALCVLAVQLFQGLNNRRRKE